MVDVIAIVGPTAVGKSALADQLAARLHSLVISADAMQVYRGMDIGTAKMPPEERTAPLELVDVVEPDEPYSAALFQRDARARIDAQRERGLVPVLCGGTGLYVRAALDELSFPSGELASDARRAYDELAQRLGPEGIYEVLRARDPESAAVIHPHNTRRVIRALEMHDEGASYARQKAGFSHHVAHYHAAYYGLTMDRARLYDRINLRVDLMFEHGLVDEVRALMARGFSEALTARQAIGYHEVIAHLSGTCTEQEAHDAIKQRTRRYAKRQLSWFRRDERIHWFDLDAITIDQAVEEILAREVG